jgi:hypothetical protein
MRIHYRASTPLLTSRGRSGKQDRLTPATPHYKRREQPYPHRAVCAQPAYPIHPLFPVGSGSFDNNDNRSSTVLPRPSDRCCTSQASQSSRSLRHPILILGRTAYRGGLALAQSPTLL